MMLLDNKSIYIYIYIYIKICICTATQLFIGLYIFSWLIRSLAPYPSDRKKSQTIVRYYCTFFWRVDNELGIQLIGQFNSSELWSGFSHIWLCWRFKPLLLVINKIMLWLLISLKTMFSILYTYRCALLKEKYALIP